MPSDAVALAPLCGQLGYPAEPSAVAARLAALRGPDHEVWIAEEGGRAVGWVEVRAATCLTTGRACEVVGLVVDEARRGAGVGRALMAHAERWATDRECCEVRLRSSIVRSGAHRFYERLGYANVKTSHAFRKALALVLIALAAVAYRARVTAAGDAPPAPPPPAARVVAAIAVAAKENAALPSDRRPTGDALCDLYVKIAAKAAGDDVRAFVVGLAHALDDSGTLARTPLLASAFLGLETPADAEARRRTMGAPTLRGRADLLKHFTVSAAVADILGPEAAAGVGLAKEVGDARGGSGFSFADLLADFAGIDLAKRLRAKEGAVSLSDLAASFQGSAWMPDPKGQPEGLSTVAFEKGYGGIADERFAKKRDELWKLVGALAETRAVAREALR